MLDKQNRIIISHKFDEVSIRKGSTINIYYDRNENLFFIDDFEDCNYFLIARRKVDNKNRFFVPSQVYETYGTKKIMCGIKDSKIYLLPMNEA